MLRRPSFLGRTAIAGVGYSSLSRRSDRSVLALAVEATREAIADAGLQLADIDGIASYSWLGDSVTTHAVATCLGLPSAHYLLDTSLGGQAPCFLIANAAAVVESGMARNVVVFRALNGRSGPRVGSRRSTGGNSRYRLPIGLTAYPQVIALWARRYMVETGATEEDLATVPMIQREYAKLNARAMVRDSLTLDEYRESPMIAAPFRLADCTIEVDGACAIVVTSTQNARSLRRPVVNIESAAYEASARSGLDPADCLLWPDYTRNYTSHLADRLWGWAGMRPSDVDCAQLYDCFSSSVLLAAEGLGLAERGGGAEFLRSKVTPTNTNGGLLCEGYLHGLNTVAEAVLQLQGRSGGVQLPSPETCVVTSGALMDGSALILARTA
jgi:acetyl-CoA acetyltransferase